MLRRLFTPRRMLVHLGVVALVVTMVNLGFWQLRRLDEKRAFNAAVTARTAEPVDDVDRVLGPDANPSEVEWRRVRATGTYDAAEAVILVNKSQDGSAGVDSLVPLRTDGGRVLLVNRGFIPLALSVPDPPTGELTVVGYLRATQTRSALGPVDSSDTGTREFQRVDIERISRQVEGDMAPMWLQMIEESPSSGSQWPARVSMPELDEGPHLSYAFQWFFFSATAILGWVVAMRRSLRAEVAEIGKV